MIDPVKLTKEESDYIICHIFGTKMVKEYFRKSDKAFRQICKGFRSESLSDEKVCQLVYNNIKTDFISSFLNRNLKLLLEQIEKNLNEIQENMQNEPEQLPLLPESETNPVFTREDAIILFLTHSDFSEMPELYFRLTEQPVTEEYLALLKAAVRIAKASNHQKTDEDAPEQIEDLQKQVETLEIITEQQETNYQEKIQKLTAQLEQTKSELLTAQKTVSELEKAKETAHIPDLTDIPETPEGFDFTSLCRISGDWLIRLADIQHGELIPFEPDYSQQLLYGNRDRLFYDRYKLAQFPRDFYGVWNWYAVENRNDASTDHVHSEYSEVMTPIEIVQTPFTAVDELTEALKQGLEISPVEQQTLFILQKSAGLCRGILCQKKQLDINEKKVKLNSDILTMNLYEISPDDVFSLGNKKFYRYIRLGAPVSSIRLYSLTNIVRKSVLQRASWSTAKQKGLTRSIWQDCRQYLEELITSDFYDEIMKKSQCTREEAETAVNEFIRYADTFVNAEDISEEILVSAIQNHQELKNQCAELAETHWKEEHHQQIAEAEKELKQILAETAQKKQDSEQLEARLEHLTSEISQKETLASEVEEKISSRILSAKENAAAFISEMAFCSPVVSKMPVSQSNIKKGTVLDSEPPKEFHETFDFFGYLEDNLIKAGVKENNQAFGLAYFLYACYRNQIPLLIAGPYGAEIADAFSAVLFSRTAGHLYCNGSFQEQLLQETENTEDTIIVIHQPFSAEWISPLLEWSAQTEKYCIFVHPFSEDLLIEPKGLMNYAVPVLTELWIDKKPTRNYFSGILKQPFPLENTGRNRTFHSDFMKKLGILGMQFSFLQTIMKDMHIMLKNQNEEFDFYFCLFPYAYLSGKCVEFMELIQNVPNIPQEMIELFKAFSGETE